MAPATSHASASSRTSSPRCSGSATEEFGRYLFYRYRYDVFPTIHEVDTFPPCLQVEPTSICNYRCVFCYQTDPALTSPRNGQMGMMSVETFRDIVDQAAGRCEALTLASRGEPLMARDIDAMIAYAAGKFLAFKINTNAWFLDERRAHAILQADPGTLVFSADAAAEPLYSTLRVNGRLDRVLENIRRFHHIRERHYPQARVITRVAGVRYGAGQNLAEMESLWGDLVDQVAFVDYNPWENTYERAVNDVAAPCSDLWRRMFVWFDGRVNPCDVDYRSTLAVGCAARPDAHRPVDRRTVHGLSRRASRDAPRHHVSMQPLHARVRIARLMICALLLGREQSTGFPGKNLLPVLGRPLMLYPLLAARAAPAIERVYVSTDSPDIKVLALQHGARVIDRPPHLATKEALGEDAFAHGYTVIRDELARTDASLELLVLLLCNAATVSSTLLESGIAALRQDAEADSAVHRVRVQHVEPASRAPPRRARIPAAVRSVRDVRRSSDAQLRPRFAGRRVLRRHGRVDRPPALSGAPARGAAAATMDGAAHRSDQAVGRARRRTTPGRFRWLSIGSAPTGSARPRRRTRMASDWFGCRSGRPPRARDRRKRPESARPRRPSSAPAAPAWRFTTRIALRRHAVSAKRLCRRAASLRRSAPI